ncbi:MAG: hypothetical protein PHT29_04750 [Eubacteriales bacterium]|jgi:rod shape-determining protein MreD|nr:hypothetical protein [Eubacteriales bacterium]MDD3290174.1 hypothetical protein [Eubacteriales bacterium]
MRIRLGHILLAYAAAFLLQTNWLSTFSVIGVSANYVLCALILLNSYSERPAVYAGAVLCGLLSDLCLGQYVGVAALAYLAVSAVLRVVSRALDQHNVLAVVYTALWATVLYETIYWLILILFGGQYRWAYLLARLPGLLFVNGVVTGILKGITR